MSWLQLSGKTAIVTGAASGFGRAVAHGLADAGCRLVVGDADKEGVERVADELKGSAEPITCNVASKTQVQALIKAGGDDASILVNCAGITRDAFITKMSEEAYDQVLDVNLKGTFLTCQEFVSAERGLQGGSIINVGSIVSEQGNLGQTNYAASKGGVLGLTRALAKELAVRRIRVNAVLPGFIDTPMAQAVPEPVLNAIKDKIPLNRLGTPQDIANLILFLASCEHAIVVRCVVGSS